MERTFIMIKPDAVRRKLIGEIVSRIEKRNFNVVAIKMLTPPKELAEAHYAVHKGKDFFDGVVQFVASGLVVAMVVEGENVIKLMRNTMGATSPEQAAPGTIRGDLTISMRENLIHGSDSLDTANMEIGLWFPELKN
jgi:nucleoside-diphosphate kinase